MCAPLMGRDVRLGGLLVVLASLFWTSPGAGQVRTSTVPRIDDGLRLRLDAQARELEVLRSSIRELHAGGDDFGPDLEAPTSQLYGFLETGFSKSWTDQEGFLYGFQRTPAWNFILGSLNLYLDLNPAPRWRALVEVSLTAAGSIDRSIGGPGTHISANTVLERAYGEWRYNDHLGLRLGLWLTPWGIWNIDHGSPTLIPLQQPRAQRLQTYPTQQMGLGIFGAVLLDGWQASYHIGISNGRLTGPQTLTDVAWPTYDPTRGKMVSGRIEVSRLTRKRFALGFGAYHGTTSVDARTVGSFTPFRLVPGIGVELTEWGIGGDLRWDVGKFRIRSEFTYTRYSFPGERPKSILYPLLLQSDSVQWAGYGLVSYLATALGIGIEPYVYVEVMWEPTSLAPLTLGYVPSAGLNLDLAPGVRWKFQFSSAFFVAANDGSIRHSPTDRFDSFDSRIVVCF